MEGPGARGLRKQQFPATCACKTGFPGRRNVGPLPEFSALAAPETTQGSSEAGHPGHIPALLRGSLWCGTPALGFLGSPG